MNEYYGVVLDSDVKSEIKIRLFKVATCKMRCVAMRCDDGGSGGSGGKSEY